MGILALERLFHQREAVISEAILVGAHVASHALLHELFALCQMSCTSLRKAIIAWSWRWLLCFDLTPLCVYLHPHRILRRCLRETVVVRGNPVQQMLVNPWVGELLFRLKNCVNIHFLHSISRLAESAWALTDFVCLVEWSTFLGELVHGVEICGWGLSSLLSSARVVIESLLRCSKPIATTRVFDSFFKVRHLWGIRCHVICDS